MITAILILGGVQLISIGIIGEYITVANYIILTVMLYILVNLIGIKAFIAGSLASILLITITFIITKLLLSGKGEKEEKNNNMIFAEAKGIGTKFLFNCF